MMAQIALHITMTHQQQSDAASVGVEFISKARNMQSFAEGTHGLRIGTLSAVLCLTWVGRAQISSEQAR